MSNKNKFRIWDSKEKKWVTENYLMDSAFNFYSRNGVCLEMDKQFDLVAQQFTGLTDKNGREIYEGDIFQIANNKVYQVKFTTGGESNHEWYGGAFVLWLNEEIFFPFDEYAMGNGRVIGNIFETPVLVQTNF